jgi:hypothetical protein
VPDGVLEGALEQLGAVLTGISLLGALGAYLRDDHGYLGTSELRAIRQRPTEEAS